LLTLDELQTSGPAIDGRLDPSELASFFGHVAPYDSVAWNGGPCKLTARTSLLAQAR
jgi:hypothetical protein